MAKTTRVQAGQIAVIYARYSSHAQNDASIEQQVAECREYAKSHQLTVVEVYADRAISGKSDRRHDFQRMMRHAENGRFAVVIAYKSNRIARNMLHALAYEDKLEKHGVRLVYVKEEFGDNAAGRFALRTMMNVNQFYSENMAEDIQRGMMDNAQQCKVNGSLPLGYRRGADGKYEIDEPAAEIVREIYRRIADDETLASIADDLNARAIKTARGKRWGKNSFHSMTENERYIGVYIYRDIRIENGIPPIVDAKTFEIVRRKIRRRKEVAGRRRENDEYLLTGKLFCGMCGAPMTGVSGTSKTGESYGYYICRTRRNDHACQKRNVRRDEIERSVALSIKQYVLREDVIEWMADAIMNFQRELKSKSQLAYYQDKLVDVKRALDNIIKAVEAGIISETMKSRLMELEGEQRELQAQIAAERNAIPTVTREQIIYWMESFRAGDVDDQEFKQQLFSNFLVSVYLYDDKMKIVYRYDKDEQSDVPVTLDDIESDGGECSFNVSSGPPEAAETNTSITISMVREVFVLTVMS